MNYSVRAEQFSSPYAEALLDSLQHAFPSTAVQKPYSTIDAIVQELIGTKQHRYGPAPSTWTLDTIRETVRISLREKQPIPIRVMWGGAKLGSFGLDIAELMSLKQLYCLQQRIRQHYEPGVRLLIQLEDLTARILHEDRPEWVDKTADYVTTFSLLHDVILNGFSEIRLESAMMDLQRLKETAHTNAMILLEIFQLSQDKRRAALDQELPFFAGHLTDAQLDHYRVCYDRFYADETTEEHDRRMALYMANSIARKLLRGIGTQTKHDIQLSFTAPVPDVVAPRRLYYRTIPERFTHQHRAPWIGKGYVRCSGDNATPAIAGFDGDGLEYFPGRLVVSSGEVAVALSADYVCG